jgi:MOSC domain-containing protein YiiM
MTPANDAVVVGRVLSVNVGRVREIVWQGRVGSTGIWKSPVAGRVTVRVGGLVGDEQAERPAHGGPDKAVYAYAREDAVWWEAQIGRTIEPGAFGENLTLTGVAVTDAVIGERWAIGSTVVLEVAEPRIPCWKLGARMHDAQFPQRFTAAGRPGAYLRVIREGDLGAGDDVRIVHRPDHGVTVGMVAFVIERDRSQADLLLGVPELPERWRAWARESLGR